MLDEDAVQTATGDDYGSALQCVIERCLQKYDRYQGVLVVHADGHAMAESLKSQTHVHVGDTAR